MEHSAAPRRCIAALAREYCSQPTIQCHSPNSDAARCAELLVRSVVAYGTLWPHEKGVMEEGCRLLSVLAGPRHHALAGGSGGGNDNGDGLGPTGGMSVAVRLDCERWGLAARRRRCARAPRG